jgi:2-polyprenyl-6-hydroxyphenyl methylase/3-demethylubiquinone-9 3-methyltransferase
LHKSLNLITKLVNDKGYLYLALYNNQGRMSIVWHKIKKFYVNSHSIVRRFLFCIFLFYFTVPRILLNFFKLDFSNPFKINGGMKLFINIEDWLGGYPFEVSKPEQIINIYKQDYTLEYLTTVAGNHENNEFLFKKKSIKF